LVNGWFLLSICFLESKMMYFRFCCAIILLVLISLVGIFLEKQNLEIRRSISKQQFQKDILHDDYSKLRLVTHQYGSPDRIYHLFKEAEPTDKEARKSKDVKDPKQKVLLSL